MWLTVGKTDISPLVSERIGIAVIGFLSNLRTIRIGLRADYWIEHLNYIFTAQEGDIKKRDTVDDGSETGLWDYRT